MATVPGATGFTDAKKTDAAVFEKPQERETTGEAQLNFFEDLRAGGMVSVPARPSSLTGRASQPPK